MGRLVAGEGARATRVNQLSENRPTRRQIMLQAKHRQRNGPRLGTGKPHYPNTAAPRWRGDGDDRVVEIHEEIVAVGTLPHGLPRRLGRL